MFKLRLILLVSFVFFISCSSLQINSNLPKDKEFKEAYNDWNTYKMESIIAKKKNIISSDELTVYESLLQERLDGIEDLDLLVGDIVFSLKHNQVTDLKGVTHDSFRNRKTLEILAGTNFSNFNIYASEPTLKKNKATNILAVNYAEETFYFDIYFNYLYPKNKKGNRWEIAKVKERG